MRRRFLPLAAAFSMMAAAAEEQQKAGSGRESGSSTPNGETFARTGDERLASGGLEAQALSGDQVLARPWLEG